MCGLLRLTMVLYGLIMVLHDLLYFLWQKISFFLAVIDPNSFGLIVIVFSIHISEFGFVILQYSQIVMYHITLISPHAYY